MSKYSPGKVEKRIRETHYELHGITCETCGHRQDKEECNDCVNYRLMREEDARSE